LDRFAHRVVVTATIREARAGVSWR
jgi:hypothetical protein